MNIHTLPKNYSFFYSSLSLSLSFFYSFLSLSSSLLSYSLLLFSSKANPQSHTHRLHKPTTNHHHTPAILHKPTLTTSTNPEPTTTTLQPSFTNPQHHTHHLHKPTNPTPQTHKAITNHHHTPAILHKPITPYLLPPQTHKPTLRPSSLRNPCSGHPLYLASFLLILLRTKLPFFDFTQTQTQNLKVFLLGWKKRVKGRWKKKREKKVRPMKGEERRKREKIVREKY